MLERLEAHRSVNVCLVGCKYIMQEALRSFLAGREIAVIHASADEEDLAAFLCDVRLDACDAIILVVTGAPFGTFHRVGEVLSQNGHAVPLVVLADQANRGEVYAALRIGAKAYLTLDADPEQLVMAIDMAKRDKVYLAPDAAELLVNDISHTSERAGEVRLPKTAISKRETEVVQLLCEGLSSKEIARHLHISAKTVENHRYNIYRKCEVDCVAALMRHAIQQGLVSV